MNKKVLNLVLSADVHPYDKMWQTSQRTWDTIDVPGVETVYYFGRSHRTNTHNMIFLDVPETLYNMGKKLIAAFEWALANKEFDYISRPHSCIYVDKNALIDYVQELPNENVFAGAVADSANGFKYVWGGIGFLITRDVVRKIVDAKHLLRTDLMEDESLSLIVSQLGIPFSDYNKACSIEKKIEGWQCISYCGKSTDFTDFAELKDLGHINYRVKQDNAREIDEIIMNELFKVLK